MFVILILFTLHFFVLNIDNKYTIIIMNFPFLFLLLMLCLSTFILADKFLILEII